MACGIAGAAYITTGQPRLRVVSCAPAYRDPASAPAENLLRRRYRLYTDEMTSAQTKV